MKNNSKYPINVLVNLAPLKKGGGQNVGLNFLNSIFSNFYEDFKFYFVVTKDSEIEKFLIKRKYDELISVSPHPFNRIVFELFKSGRLLKKNNIDIIYTYFGYGLYPVKVPQVCGSAVSNIYYPEINFWKNYNIFIRISKWLIDKFRIWGVKRSTAIIFENKSMLKRCIELYNKKNVIYIPPSVNFNFTELDYKLPKYINKSTPLGLFLCDWHRNKNVFFIPEIISRLKILGQPIHIILTAPNNNSKEHLFFIKLCKKHSVMDNISIIGKIKKEQLASLYSQIDYVFLLSQLESFSNNIIEAWYFKKLLIVSDELWSHELCENAALFVNRNATKEIAESIVMINNNIELKNEIIQNGNNMLMKFPKIDDRTFSELTFLKEVYENN